MRKILDEAGNELYTTAQVAVIVGRSESTLRQWVMKGQASPYCACGGTHLWRHADFENVRKGKAGRPTK